MKTPALDAWRRELAAGQRTKYDFDPLWRAACQEMNALEAPTPGLAQFFLSEAHRIIQSARASERGSTVPSRPAAKRVVDDRKGGVA